jgi:light-regulated signal transduction histidine kinase (bacteriophytochrome)
LRAPLRSIDGFSKALLEDYESRLDQDGRDYLNRVRKATQRMAALIDDLLALSRVGRMEMRAESMNLGTLAGEIVEELKRQEPARKVDVRIEPALTARGDSSLMRIALQNLLQNAWKFTSRTAAARIEVGKSSHNGNDTFFVRDNGVGFDMAYAGKLFGAFQRLHAESEFPGTGIGLATVQRIIRRHGGEVRAQAVVGEGTTIFFTLGAGRPSDDPGARG